MLHELKTSTVQNLSWVTDSSPAGGGILHLLKNPKVSYRIHNRPPLVPVINHTRPLPLQPILFLEDPV
jgi:hypothetical protein